MNTNLDELLELLEGQKYENYIMAKCIFHSDSRPSLMIHADSYKCLSCGAHGSTQSLLSNLSKSIPVAMFQATKEYRNPFTEWLRKDQYVEKILIKAWQSLTTNPHQATYLHSRGISAEDCKRFLLGYRENWFTIPLKSMNNSIVGAIARAGEGNDSESKYVVPAGQSPNILYIPSIKSIEKSDKIYLTFGPLDALSLSVCGIAAVSTTVGKRLSPAALNNFKKTIIIIPDRGEEKEAYEIAACLGWRGKVLHGRYPEGAKDCNDVLRLYGPAKLQAMLE